MISKAKLKYVRSLAQKKYRLQEHVFVAEGPKIVNDIMKDIRPCMIIATTEWLTANQNRLNSSTDTIEVTDEELIKVSFLQHPQMVFAVFPLPPKEDETYLAKEAFRMIEHQLCLALDGIQDPGNLGTIIRIADWFGIEHIFCSHETADAYSPKVIQATMGSINRVKIHYVNLSTLLANLPAEYPVYGTLLNGKDIYQQPLTGHGLIIMGNEGNGISPEIRSKINRKLLIPNFPQGRETTDSLNVAIATAVTCAEFRRQSSNTRR